MAQKIEYLTYKNERNSFCMNKKTRLKIPKPISFYTRVLDRLRRDNGYVGFLEFIKQILNCKKENPCFLLEDEKILDVLRECGMWMDVVRCSPDSKDQRVVLNFHKPLVECEFCFVDIEVTGSNPLLGSIIDLAVIKVKNLKVLDRFHTLVHANTIPDEIIQLTGITPNLLIGARSEKEALEEFRRFLGSSVFVAHNVEFDYDFISSRLEHHGFLGLLNPRVCTVQLAKKTIASTRHSLSHLNTFLNINLPFLHRAYNDAYACMRVFETILSLLPEQTQSLQDLFDFVERTKKS